MMKIQQITADASQQQNLVLPDGTQIAFSMLYLPGQQCWMANISYGSLFTINGLQVVNNPNLLLPWQNVIPFGLGCFSVAGREPSLINDFQSGYTALYVLDSTDVAAYTAALQNGTASIA